MARREFARLVEDVLVRRLHLYYETTDRGAGAAGRTAELLGAELGWSAERIEKERLRYHAMATDPLPSA